MQKKFIILLNILIIFTLVLAACKQENAAPTSLPPTSVPPTSTPAPTAEPTAVPPTPTLAPAVAVPVGALPAGLPQGSNGFAWWNDSTFYEIFVRSFFDSNGDGIGDFNGITQKLDYLNDGDPAATTDLGVTGLWLMPVFPSPSYHGYDTTDYFGVNPDYGTMDDFKKLLDEAHKRGIRIVIDMMLNHTSSEHPWFKESTNPQSPYRNWYIWSDTDPGGLGPWNQDVWHEGPNGGFFYGVFWEGMPDLNYDNPEVVAKMDEVVNFWLKDVKVDGLRLDGARYIVEEGDTQADSPANHAYLKHLREE